MNILLTGVTGFIGSHVARRLSLKKATKVFAITRREVDSVLTGIELLEVKTPLEENVFFQIPVSIDCVVHTAARAHMTGEISGSSLSEFRKVNVEWTLNLAKQAAALGVNRFVFISSIGVNGNINYKPFLEVDDENPQETYAVSKLEAEQGLLKISQETGMEVVIIRPPLVYGANAPGNFHVLLKWVARGLPLPLGAVHNQRSLVALDNLVDFIILCAQHPKAANEVFLISDGEDVSTTELLQKVAKAMGKKARLLPVPVGLMRFVAKLLGKEDVANRLFGSLQVDSSKAREILGWTPVITMDEQLKKMVEVNDKATV